MRKAISALAAALMLTSALTSCAAIPITELFENGESTAATTEASSTTETTEETEKTSSAKTTKASSEKKRRTTTSSTEAVTTEKTKSASTEKTGKTSASKSKKETTTTAKAGSGSGNAQVSGSIIGKWCFDNYDSEEFSGLADLADTTMNVEMTFNADNSLEMTNIVGSDSIMSINGDKFVMSGMEYDYEYDGSTISILGTELFKRVDAPDPENVYGRYSYSSTLFSGADPEFSSVYIDFTAPGKGTIYYGMKGSYTYDTETSQLSIDIDDTEQLFENESVTCVVSGDTLTITDDYGDNITMHRV